MQTSNRLDLENASDWRGAGLPALTTSISRASDCKVLSTVCAASLRVREDWRNYRKNSVYPDGRQEGSACFAKETLLNRASFSANILDMASG